VHDPQIQPLDVIREPENNFSGDSASTAAKWPKTSEKALKQVEK
jgi:hypothetical protein